MLKILRLEYLYTRRQIVIVLAIYSAYFAYMAGRIESPRVFIVMLSLMIGLSMPFAILAREDKFKTAAFVCSLPVRRSTVVLGKYVSAWAAIAVGFGYALLLTSVLPFSKVRVAEILTVKTILISIFLMSLIFAVILPFTIRFGLVGIIVLLVGSQFVLILALILTRMLGARNPMRAFFRAVEGGLRALLSHGATPGFLLTLMAAIIALNVLSLVVSRVLYARRDL
jgi:ABC-type transport system involved in multi-copper enzyme maturation permease subunit